MRKYLRSVVALGGCFWMLLAERSGARQELPRGQIIDSVQCATDSAQTYALYLPAGYTPERAWPLLMGFHPGARGRAIVEKYRDAAERYGYIVAASNNSRNGPWEVSGRAVTAMARDLGTRFSTDPKRVYATGHSGGAGGALQLALRNPIAGVIASSAGFPDRLPRSKLAFVLFGTAGETAQEDLIATLLRNPETKRALDRQRDTDRSELQLLEEIGRLEAGLGDNATRNDSFVSLRHLLQDCQKKATAPEDSPQRSSARRVLRVVTMGGSERVQDAEYLALLQKYR